MMTLRIRIDWIVVVDNRSIKEALALETGIPQDRLTILSVAEDTYSSQYIVTHEVKEE